jgi:hypothetical protein
LDSRLREGNPCVIFKLDLEKAYYYVNREFLSYLMGRCGFGFKRRKWIFAFISTVRFFILVNGNLYGFLVVLDAFAKGILSRPFFS